MKAVRVEDGSLGVANVAAPSGDGVRIKVRSAGICGSDLHMLDLGMVAPVTLGHEIAGELSDGTPVAVEPLGPCGHCAYCVAGDYNLCVMGSEMIYGVLRDGGMAEEMLVPERSLVSLPRGVRAVDACLVEPLAVAVHGLRAIELRGDQRVAVIGGGAIGLCAVAAARPSGGDVARVARHDAQRAAGERLGAKLDTEGSYDVVVDAAGTRSSLEQAAELCRPGGTMVLLASYWGGMEMPGMTICAKEIRIVPSAMYGRRGLARDVDVAASLLGGFPDIPDAIISHRLPLDAAVEAFGVARDRKAGALKVVLEP